MKRMNVVLVPVFLFACAPTETKNSSLQGDLEGLAPPPAGHGIQLRMTETIAPGNESYGCQLFQMPDEDLFVHEQTVQFTRGGHHILLYKTPYQTIPERDENGMLVNGAEVHDCSEGVTSRWKVNSVLGGSEIFDHPGMFRGLPEGVAVRLPGKTIVVMSVHYLNATPQPVDVDARVNLSTIDGKDVKMEAGLLYLDNQMLHVAPMGKSTSRMRCPIPSDVSVVNLQSHMHARGASFSATVFGAKGLSEVVYETNRWLEPPVQTYEPYLALRIGSLLETRCEYANDDARTIGYGPRSTDEMCQLIGPYFPRDEHFEACANAQGGWAAEWVGEGLADGVTTVSCFECAQTVDSAEYVACIDAACPSIADRVSAVVRCERARGVGACGAERIALKQANCY